MGRRLVKLKAVTVQSVSLRHKGRARRVPVGVQVIEYDVYPALTVVLGHKIHEGEEMLTGTPKRAASEYLARADIEAAEQTPRPMPARRRNPRGGGDKARGGGKVGAPFR